MLYTRFYDQVLTELVAGKVQDGVNLLVGMLDTVGLRSGALRGAKNELCAHSLAHMLREDPVIAHARAHPTLAAERIGLLKDGAANEGISSTGRKLFAVTRNLPFARALRQRQRDYTDRLHRAVRQGQNICVLTSSTDSDFNPRDAVSSENYMHIQINDSPDFWQCAPPQSQRFDIILAPDLLDQASPGELISLLGPYLVQQGSIIAAALVQDHLGAGWRSTCLNWDPPCHDESSLARLAKQAGMTARTYYDDTGCIIWVEFRLAENAKKIGGRGL